MNRIGVFLVFLIGCGPVGGQSCDLCGKWSFERFEYAGHITTDCKDTADHFYKNSYLVIDKDSFFKTYCTDDKHQEVKNTHIVPGEYDSDEAAQEIFIKLGGRILETFYKPTPNTLYLLSDGCRFYFKRN